MCNRLMALAVGAAPSVSNTGADPRSTSIRWLGRRQKQPLTALALLESRNEDAVSNLQRRISSGETKLVFEAGNGYLKSSLDNLDIPVSSQGFVFSKSSFQFSRISEHRPCFGTQRPICHLQPNWSDSMARQLEIESIAART